ncbi:PAS domain-containing sensor histidine kinase [Novosphingobium sp. 9U]|uniref:hybrid sensor histidine kinase/response regulator n=1 Tax=Novosphingobium sp. 9U TaxID=2653158 RepID=UPI0012F161CB|nr:PAS domain-containing sensor histidine kinase [Novosphingobium sp. 9U]VWX49378.1 Hybrid sensor histidine kinase/response regulator [Novosphingobium sp. 9U]
MADFQKDPPAETFQLLVDAVTDYALYMLDRDGHIVTWNAGAQRFKGYSADEIIGEHFSKFFLPDDRRDGLPSQILKTAAEQKRFEMEGWRLRKDGTKFLAHVVVDAIHDEGVLVGFAKITRDITEKRSLEQATYDSALQLRMLVQGVRDYAIYMLDTDGRITSWNAGARTIKGYEEEEVLRQHFSLFYTEEDRARGAPEEALRTALQEGKFEAEAQRVRKDGSLFWAHVVIDPIYNEVGEHVGFAKITRDISERKRNEIELRQTQEALLQSQKLQALGELAGGIAHDFNNLMTVMRGSADFMLRKPDLPLEKRNRYLSVMLETAERATSLTSQLLAFARRQPLEPEVIDLTVRLDAMGEMLQRTLGSLYDLKLDLTPALWPVEIDPSGLEAALLNAVLNARDAMPKGGRITITTKNVSRAEGEGVTLSITDTGQGILPETLKRVFEPFFTTKPTGKGTGLGLSQIHGFAEQSGGSARIISEVGQGTTVELWLPKTNKQRQSGTASERESLASLNLKVLVVEDSEHVRYFARQLLDDLGCDVVEASDADQALKLLKGQKVDLVFSDIVMPGMSGLELAEHIKEKHRGVPVLLASGYSSKQFISKDERQFPIIRKPYEIETLAAGINQLISRAQTKIGAVI